MAADQTRERLVQHGRDLYLGVGAAHFSLREVARRVGVSPAAVYRHFANKEALLAAVCEEGFRIFASYLMRALAASTPVDRLRAAADMYRQFALDHPHDYRVIFVATLKHDDAGVPVETGAHTFQFLVDRVRECLDTGVLTPGDPVEIALQIWASLHGLVALRLSGHLWTVGDDAAFTDLFTRLADALLRGLARVAST